MVNLAARHGITLVLDPAETGTFLNLLKRTVSKDQAYGMFLGERYNGVEHHLDVRQRLPKRPVEDLRPGPWALGGRDADPANSRRSSSTSTSTSYDTDVGRSDRHEPRTPTIPRTTPS